MNHRIRVLAGAVALSISSTVNAAQKPEEIRQLGTSLLPWGAEKAGNAAGTVPAYTGQVKVPAAYDPKKPGIRPDPFADEKPLLLIDAKNMEQHAGRLSPGVMAMMRKYPSFRIDVYPSHRTMVYPKWVQDNSIKNATSCQAVNNNLTLKGCYGGVPFPIPKSGSEVMWNHVVKYSAPESWTGRFQTWVVGGSNAPTLQADQVAAYNSPFFDEKREGPNPEGTDFFQFRADMTGPARRAGEKLLILESTAMGPGGTRVWQYLPGQRRVKLSPDLAYDTPNPQSGGASTMDDARAFAGALDRFDFKLIGKKEMYIPYNTFKMQAGGQCSNAQLMTPKHLNPDCVRWELHRVWVVEGVPKQGVRHIYSKRIMYFDEDAPGAGISDGYDAVGKPYRVNMVFPYPFYEAPAQATDRFASFDLATGTYNEAVGATETGGWYLIGRKPSSYYTSDSLAASGVR
ncbi:DUF1329 domain-containing protein [Massilia niabensis]|uniref:DUF1329 domain-containing protein n=1 Tax=Massilia niabensis TaxID=544910 RepID=A0ABW0LBD7_9BURK